MKNIENRKLNIMFLIVFLALIGIYFLLQQPTNNPEKRIVRLSHPEKINKIEIINSNISTVLVKNNDSWFIQENDALLESNADLIGGLMDVLSTEMKLEKISNKVDKYSIYELDEDQIVYLKIYQDEKLIQEFGIGKMGSVYPSSFMKLKNDLTVYQANNFLTFIVRNSDWLKIEDLEENSGDLEEI